MLLIEDRHEIFYTIEMNLEKDRSESPAEVPIKVRQWNCSSFVWFIQTAQWGSRVEKTCFQVQHLDYCPRVIQVNFVLYVCLVGRTSTQDVRLVRVTLKLYKSLTVYPTIKIKLTKILLK